MKYLNKTIYLRNHQGQNVGGITRVKTVVIAAFLITVIVGSLYSIATVSAVTGNADGVSVQPVVGLEAVAETGGSGSLDEDCTKDSEGFVDCTDQATRLRIYELTDGGKKPIKWYSWDEAVKGVSKVKASVTMYSRESSCHFPQGKKCLTAAGRDTLEGTTIACPRNLKLGTQVKVNGKTYTCEDRYSTYLDKKRGMPTFDIFTENHTNALKWGVKVLEVEVL